VAGVTRNTVQGDKVTRPTVELAGASQIFGNIVTGETGALVGFRANPVLGSTTEPNPDPPGGGTTLFDIIQFSGLTWEISFSPSPVAVDAWTSVTLDNNIDTPIVLLSAAATYSGTVFTTPITSRWVFTATADLWHKLGSGAQVSAIFA
jgi:hypothetical protein